MTMRIQSDSYFEYLFSKIISIEKRISLLCLCRNFGSISKMPSPGFTGDIAASLVDWSVYRSVVVKHFACLEGVVLQTIVKERM